MFRIILGSFNLLPTYDLIGNSINVFSNGKVELRVIEHCSFNLIFSSGSNLNNEDSSTLSDKA